MDKIYFIIIMDTFEFDLIEINQIKGYRSSNDGLKIMIAYETEPAFFSLLTTKQGPYDENEIKVISQTPEWTEY
jgi:hypothetical protein